jgi:hypothetical protein
MYCHSAVAHVPRPANYEGYMVEECTRTRTSATTLKSGPLRALQKIHSLGAGSTLLRRKPNTDIIAETARYLSAEMGPEMIWFGSRFVRPNKVESKPFC